MVQITVVDMYWLQNRQMALQLCSYETVKMFALIHHVATGSTVMSCCTPKKDCHLFHNIT